MLKVSLIILHFLDKKATLDCLNSIRKLNIKDFILQTILVNNNPKEELGDLKKDFKGISLIRAQSNLGYAGGNNLGIKQALGDEADYLFMVNNDTILEKNSLLRLIEVGNSNIRSGILGPKIYFAPGFEFHKNRYKKSERGRVLWYAGGIMDWKNVIGRHRGVDEVGDGQYEKIEETNFVSGCAMLVKKEVFEKIGPLDENYFLYYEDNDFCQKAKKAGFKILFVPKAVVWHKNAGSSRVGSPLHDYYITRNRLLFGMHWAPLRAKLALLRESLRLLFIGRTWQKRGVVDFYLGRFGKGSYEA